MKLSLIIPAYNAEKHLDNCLESCFRQNLDVNDYEVIIINDGSTDNTQTIAENWREKHSNINVISQENKGLSEARNAGLDSACGSYIMFIDSDDMIAEDSLKNLWEICSKGKPDILRFCAADMIEGKAVKRYAYKDGCCTGKDLLKTRFQVCAPFALYRNDFLKENNLRFYPGIYHEDNEFTPKAYYYADKVISINSLIYFVNQTPGSITRSSNPRKSHDLLRITELLSDFALTQTEEKYRKYIEKQISDCLNSCFKNMLTLHTDSQEELKEIILKRKGVFRHFLRSSSLLHNIEGMILCIFPKHMLGIYRTLNLIHK